jgi:hypothetical protein
VRAINAGGGASGSFLSDRGFSGGAARRVNATIDTSLVTDPAAQAVYRTWRAGTFSYTIGGLTPGISYSVRLHFSENAATAAGRDVFNVVANGTRVLSSFDVFAAAGGRFKAVTRQFNVTANSLGRVVLRFAAVMGGARVNGIEVFEV